MNLTEASARALLKTLGYENADKFTLTILEQKLAGVSGLPELARERVTEPAQRRLLATLIRSTRLERPKVIATPKPQKEYGGNYMGHAEVDGEAALLERPDVRRKKGVQYWIYQILKEATAERPVTKDQILEVLCEKFPERSTVGMGTTVNGLGTWVPVRYPEYEVVRVAPGGRKAESYYVRKVRSP